VVSENRAQWLAKIKRIGFAAKEGDVGRAMTAADTYRRYAAECLRMSRQRENLSDKAMFVQMATMWQRLAELSDRNEGADDSSSTAL
jgi:hypothetical protein